jgi:hypothetical protein
MFHEDHSLRDFVMFGSVVLMALAAMPMSRAAAEEFYFCGDGRTLELRHGDKLPAGRSDPCIAAWAESARKTTVPATRETAPQTDLKLVLGNALLVHTSTIVNAEEVPAQGPLNVRKASRSRHVVTAHKGKVSRPGGRGLGMDGLRYVGDGIYAR